MRKRGELIERSFAHCCDTGGMRRTHLRGHKNILKRVLIHVAGFDLSLVPRRLLGFGTARGLQGLSVALLALWRMCRSCLRGARKITRAIHRIEVCQALRLQLAA